MRCFFLEEGSGGKVDPDTFRVITLIFNEKSSLCREFRS
jgi:hypothetical protein